MSAAPLPLPENAGLAFIGEAEWLPALITARQAETFVAARNPAGRPNSDVLRSIVGRSKRHTRTRWQIDFPTHYREQEAALHERPFAYLKKRRGAAGGSWWINPHTQPSLRHALARLDRFLATALASPQPAWFWIESDRLPDDSLLAVARDDDFTHAVLESTVFAVWWHANVQKQTPLQIIGSFPFPWPPLAPLGSLTKAQQEIRSAATRAGLAGDAEQIDAAIAAAYGWSEIPAADEITQRLGWPRPHPGQSPR